MKKAKPSILQTNENSDFPEEVYQVLANSGTTAIASSQEGKNRIGFEADDTYSEIVNERLEQLEG